MIRPSLHQVAKKKGIRNAYQFQKATGFTISTAYALWNNEWKLVNLKTLNTLCNILDCKPNDLLKFTPDPDEE